MYKMEEFDKLLTLCNVAMRESEQLARCENEYAKSLSERYFSPYMENTSNELRKKYSFKCKFSPDVCSVVKESYGNEEKALLEIKKHLINEHSVPAIMRRRRSTRYNSDFLLWKTINQPQIKKNVKEEKVHLLLEKDFEANNSLDCGLNAIKDGDFEHTYAKSPHQFIDTIPLIPEPGRKNRRVKRVLPSRNLDSNKHVVSYSFPVPLTIPTPDFPLVHDASDVSCRIELDLNGDPVDLNDPIFIYSTQSKKNKMSRKKSKIVPEVNAPRSVLGCIENRFARKSQQNDIVLQDNIENIDKNLILSEQSKKRRCRKKPEDYICEICDKRFTAKSSLSYHHMSHFKMKTFTCNLCKKNLTRQSSLKYHMMVHDNIIRFRCDMCPRGFRHRSHYKNHLRDHTGEKPFSCEFCSNRFKMRYSYKKHLKMHHQKDLTCNGIIVPTCSDS